MIENLKPYETYKDSGVEWLGEVPEHWETRRLRTIASISTGERDLVDRREDGKYPFFVRSKIVERIDTWSYEGEAVLTAGDGDVGEIFHYINQRFDFHQRVYKFSNFIGMRGRFFYYQIQSTFRHQVSKGTAKTTVESLRLPMLQNFPMCFPSPREQTAIVRFLDHSTQQIDQLIETNERMIELLKKLKQATIQEAVTGRIDVRTGKPYSQYKDSGVEWLGEVPEHWEIRSLKNMCTHSALYGANLPADSYGTNGVRFLRTTDITEDSRLESGGVFVPESLVDGYVLKNGDLLFSRSGSIGRTFLYNRDEHGKCAYAGYLVRFVPQPSVSSQYLHFFTRTNSFAGFLKTSAIATTIENLNGQKFAKCQFTLPPSSEQHAIARFLIGTINRIERAINARTKNIDLLKEYRTVLVADVVTGKLDVSDADKELRRVNNGG